MTMRFQSALADIGPVQRVDLRDLVLPPAREAVSTSKATPIAVAFGDGVGPELMFASLRVLFAAGARISVDSVELGAGTRRSKREAGLTALDTVRRNKVLLKGPLQPEPGSSGWIDELFAKVLPLGVSVRSYLPCPVSQAPRRLMRGVVVVHDAVGPSEGPEYRQSESLYSKETTVNRARCEAIIHSAFDYAVRHGLRRIACALDSQRPSLSDAMVSALFDRIAARHGGIVCEHWTVAAAAARLVSEPERFDVIVAPASGAHVLATIAQETASAVGVAHAAHFGPACAVFEGSHGPVHALTGKDRANPSALILAGATMLDHIGQHDVAVRVRNAWLRTIEDGIRTFDMNADDSGDEVGTAAFSGAVIDRLGQEPILLASAHTRRHATLYALPDVSPATSKAAGEPRQRVGADLVVDAPGLSPDAVVSRLHACEGEQFRLTKLHSRAGSSAGFGERAGQHGWSCRYMARLGTVLDARAVAALEMRVAEQGLECVETRHLFSFAGAAGFSAASSS